MSKQTLVTTAVVAALAGPAIAAEETWLVTEESSDEIMGAQGTWNVSVQGNKLSGVAAMFADNGKQVTYKFDGAIEGGVYTVALDDRSDGKKGCVWNGHAPDGAGDLKKGLIGYLECDGVKLIVRASIVGQ